MRVVPVDKLEEGMVLAEAVTDRLGRVLLREGDVLKGRMIGKLADWGVSTVSVEDDNGGGPDLSDLDPEAVTRARDLLAARFTGHDDDERMAVVREAVLPHLAERLER